MGFLNGSYLVIYPCSNRATNGVVIISCIFNWLHFMVEEPRFKYLYRLRPALGAKSVNLFN